jgi:pyruvate formate lyase activating enzyme
VHAGSCADFHFEDEGLFWNRPDDPEALDEIRTLCPAQALQVIGEEKTVEEVIENVERDRIFYEDSLGGLTVSGGEPLSQPEFTIALFKEAKKRGIHCAAESCGYGKWEDMRRMAEHLDYFLTDIKCIRDSVHKKYTGLSNQLILDNFRRLREAYPDLPIQVRTPVIPGINDNEESISAIAEFLAPYDNVRYELLQYHRLGEPKYQALHRRYRMGTRELDNERFRELRQYEFNKIDDSITGEGWEDGAGI